MPEDGLTEYLQARAGEYLRGVVKYDADSFEIIHIREGLNPAAFRERVEHIHTNITQRPTVETGEDSFGKPYATLSVREYAVVLNLRWTPTEGIIVGLEPDAARDLVSFIHETMDRGFPEGPPP